jgi:hypothetical protein
MRASPFRRSQPAGLFPPSVRHFEGDACVAPTGVSFLPGDLGGSW